MKTRVGTIYYVAPEVLTSEYTTKCDVWSIGIICYVLLCGFPPFNAGNERNTYKLVEEGNVTFPSPAWDHISGEAISFIKRLTQKDPDLRPTAAEALQDPWIQQADVQPQGLARHASFFPRDTAPAKKVSKERQIQYSDAHNAGAFARFLQKIKVSDQIQWMLNQKQTQRNYLSSDPGCWFRLYLQMSKARKVSY